MESWKKGILILLALCVIGGFITLVVFLAGGFYVATNPDVQAKIIVATFNSNAQNVYSSLSNTVSNVSCLPLTANLAYLYDQNGSLAIRSGSCPSGTTATGPSRGGFIVCNPSGIMSNTLVLNSFNKWSTCLSGTGLSPGPSMSPISTPPPPPPPPSPVACQISPNWSEWSACSTQCGPGQKTRTKTILQQPLYGGTPCGATTESEYCYIQSCNDGPGDKGGFSRNLTPIPAWDPVPPPQVFVPQLPPPDFTFDMSGMSLW